MTDIFPAKPPVASVPKSQSANTLPGDIGAPPPPRPGTSVITPASPRRGFPKLLLIVLLLVVLGIVGYLGLQSFAPKLGKGGNVTLTWWGLWEDSSVIQPLIDEYQTANPKVKINYVMQSQKDYRERLTNAIAKGEGPDIFKFHNTWVPMFKKDLDYVPPSVMSAGEYAQTFFPVVSADLTSGTGLVGIPLGYDGLALYINQDIFDKAGKTPPATWNELRQLAKELTIEENGQIVQSGVALGRTENVDHWQEIIALMMMQSGVSLSKPVGQKAENALTYYTLFSSADHVWDETLPPSTTYFASGKLAMYFGPSWRVFEIKQKNPSLKFKAVPLPQLPKLDPNDPDVAYSTYWVEGVWSRSKNKEEAWKFLKFISSKDSLEKMYRNAAKTRMFGEPYPRVDMADLIKNDPYIGTIVSSAPNAQSWFLVSSTHDGQTGINSLLSKYFEDAINAVNKGTNANTVSGTVASGVAQVLSQYGLAVR